MKDWKLLRPRFRTSKLSIYPTTTYVYTYIHTYIQTYIHIYIYAHRLTIRRSLFVFYLCIYTSVYIFNSPTHLRTRTHTQPRDLKIGSQRLWKRYIVLSSFSFFFFCLFGEIYTRYNLRLDTHNYINIKKCDICRGTNTFKRLYTRILKEQRLLRVKTIREHRVNVTYELPRFDDFNDR